MWSLKIFFVILVLFLSSPQIVWAGNNLVVQCSGVGVCDISPKNVPLFEEGNLFPGQNFNQNLMVINNGNSSCSLGLKFIDTTPIQNIDLAQKITTKFSYNSQFQKEYTFRELFTLGQVSLGTLNSGEKRGYDWDSNFDENADNSYQNLKTQFDLNLVFSCLNSSEFQALPSVLSESDSGETVFNQESTASGSILSLVDKNSFVCVKSRLGEILLFLSQILFSLLCLWLMKTLHFPKVSWFVFMPLGLVFQIFHYSFFCSCFHSLFCSYYWLVNFILTLGVGFWGRK